MRAYLQSVASERIFVNILAPKQKSGLPDRTIAVAVVDVAYDLAVGKTSVDDVRRLPPETSSYSFTNDETLRVG